MKTINVVAAVIFKDGRVFATQRGYGEFKDGWEFPGGKIEPGVRRMRSVVRFVRNLRLRSMSVNLLIPLSMTTRLFTCP